MPTILRRLPQDNPNSVGIPAVSITDAEIAVHSHPGLVRAFRADTSLDLTAGTWKCRKSDALITKGSSGVPTFQAALEAYNSKPSLLIPGGNNRMRGVGLVPTDGPLSMVVVGRSGPDDNANIIGTESTVGAGTFIQQRGANAGDGLFTFSVEGVNRATTSYARKFADGPNIVVASHVPRTSDGDMVLRINRGRGLRTVLADAALNVKNSSSNLSVGYSGPNTAISGILEGGDIAEILIFNFAIHTDPAYMALVEAYLGTRYGITAP
jgi:hypothetical protein